MTITFKTTIRIGDGYIAEKTISKEFEYRLTKEDLDSFIGMLGFENAQKYLELFVPDDEDEVGFCMDNYNKGCLVDFEYYISHYKEQEKELERWLCYKYDKEIVQWLIKNLNHWDDVPYVWLNDIVNKQKGGETKKGRSRNVPVFLYPSILLCTA